MPELVVFIDTPTENTAVGRHVALRGKVGAINGYLESVSVRFDGSEQAFPAAIHDEWSWSWQGDLPGSPSGGGPITTRVQAQGQRQVRPKPEPEFEPIAGETSRVLRAEAVPPIVAIDGFESPVSPPTFPHAFVLSGTAQDAPGAESGVARVDVQWNDGAFAPAEQTGAGWSRWRMPFALPAGEHRFTVRATDGFGNSAQQQRYLVVREIERPAPADQAFAPVTYLNSLLRFAKRAIRVNGGEGPDAVMLAARFMQPFDRLVDPAQFERATAPVQRLRVAVEVLRRALSGEAPAAADRAFRDGVVASMLADAGAGVDEVRLARTDDAATRAALAQRLGIRLEPARPDALDRLSAAAQGNATSAEVEALFGVASTQSGDPLPAPPPRAAWLTWRQDALRTRWLAQDAEQRDVPGLERPVVDPDLVTAAEIASPVPGDATFTLWAERAAWLEAELARIRARASDGASELARFDGVIADFVGPIDIAALAALDADGADIGVALAAVQLALGEFRFLARSRAVAASTTLDGDWADVHDIVLRVRKRRVARDWRAQERAVGVMVSSQHLRADDGPSTTPPPGLGEWRRDDADVLAWRQLLGARDAQAQALVDAFAQAVDTAEAVALPALRDALLAHAGSRRNPPLPPDEVAHVLSREWAIDLRGTVPSKASRAQVAIETLQQVLFATRAGRFAGDPSRWTIDAASSFDAEWPWMKGFTTWLAAERAFAYPENQLMPSLYVIDAPHLAPTVHYAAFVGDRLRRQARPSPAAARSLAAEYLAAIRADASLALPDAVRAATFRITDQRSDAQLAELQALTQSLVGNAQPHALPSWMWETFWFVPMALAARLLEAGHHTAALDWYRGVFAFHLGPDRRKVWHGLAREGEVASNYDRTPQWLLDQANPHTVAKVRRNAYTRATVLAIANALLRFADAEFTRGSTEAAARARSLYEAAQDVLALPEVQPDAAESARYPANPVWQAMALRAGTSLGRIHAGLNLAGLPVAPTLPDEGADAVALPSPYRYAVLVERAKSFASTAAQIEAAYLQALQAADAENLSALQAGQGLELAHSSVSLLDLRVADAKAGVDEARLRANRARLQTRQLGDQVRSGLSMGDIASIYGGMIGGAASGGPAAGFTGMFGLLGAVGGIEDRKEELRRQAALARADEAVARAQWSRADGQRRIAQAEREQSMLQLAHAQAVFDFLSTKFTNAELFEWMASVLGGVYAYFLNQATALAQQAQAQLAFERQEASLAFVASDYWSDGGSNGDGQGEDRRGLTGSARLQQDIARLDQFAFETDRRKLQVSQTIAVSQLAPAELQHLRRTGVLEFATPMALFDHEFPGHYLRLIQRVRVSLQAVVPPVRGVRATLSSAGLSRVVVARDGAFVPVTLTRPPEEISFTAASQATGVFELEPDNGLLRPFEGMGVDTRWRLELPKAANPFDFTQITDVLLTLEYTALSSRDYRERIAAGLGRTLEGDRAFSVRQQFPDAWFDLHNPDTVDDPARRMRIDLPLEHGDFAPHLDGVRLRHLTLVALRRDGFTSELPVASVSLEGAAGRVDSTAEVRTTQGVAGTRRPAGTGWLPFVGRDPAGQWSIRLHDTPEQRAWFTEHRIDDLVLVTTIEGQAPAWT